MSDTAAAILDAYIRRHQLKEGDRLPPERELAVELNVGRRELRRLLASIELEGRIWRGKRKGTFLGSHPPDAAVSVDRSLALASPAAIMSCRLMIEPAVAAAAALGASECDLSSIELCLRRTVEVTDDAGWTRWDGAFHRAIAESSGNAVIVALIRSFNKARTQAPWSKTRVVALTAERRRREVMHHRAIFDAIRSRDSHAASRAMREHLVGVRDDLAGLF